MFLQHVLKMYLKASRMTGKKVIYVNSGAFQFKQWKSSLL